MRPLLNCLKITFPEYLELGAEVSLDEASVSCRSRYGGDVIFYNPRKPGGKFHFRFYMLCCSSSYACVRLRMHTRNMTDVADATPTAGITTVGHSQGSEVDISTDLSRKGTAGLKTTGLSDDESTHCHEPTGVTGNEKQKSGVLISLVMDMCAPLFGSGRIVNMDNYYTSPVLAYQLAQKKVYMRGTCRMNRKGFPTGISFTSLEKKNWERGTMKGMIERRKRIAAFGWLDGNPVHFITTADGNAATTVYRRVGRERRQIEAPVKKLQHWHASS